MKSNFNICCITDQGSPVSWQHFDVTLEEAVASMEKLWKERENHRWDRPIIVGYLFDSREKRLRTYIAVLDKITEVG